jgi:hypothetical protein
MAPRKRKKTASRRKKPMKKAEFEVGQRVQVNGYGEGTVIAIEARRGGRYSDVWVRPDDSPAKEIGVPYKRELIEPA